MDKVKDFLVGLGLILLAVFGINKLKNEQALDEHEEALEAVKKMEEEKAQAQGALEVLEEMREEARIVLAEKLDRRATNEEVNDFLNNRYHNS
tara:strand:- start:180 stop:458 length:279 start_codon:yes stop_codon:yes gene_type:complete